jgi:Flp pilus assembly protein TadD
MDAVQRYRTAQEMLTRGNPHAALTVVEPLIEQEPDAAAVLILAARACFDSARLERAEALFRRLVELDPTNHYAHAGLGRTLQRRSRHREALPHLRLANALHSEPWYASALARAEASLAGQGSCSGQSQNGPGATPVADHDGGGA